MTGIQRILGRLLILGLIGLPALASAQNYSTGYSTWGDAGGNSYFNAGFSAGYDTSGVRGPELGEIAVNGNVYTWFQIFGSGQVPAVAYAGHANTTWVRPNGYYSSGLTTGGKISHELYIFGQQVPTSTHPGGVYPNGKVLLNPNQAVGPQYNQEFWCGIVPCTLHVGAQLAESVTLTGKVWANEVSGTLTPAITLSAKALFGVGGVYGSCPFCVGASAGVGGELTLLRVSLPLNYSMALQTVSTTPPCLGQFNGTRKIDLTVNTLSGHIFIYATACLGGCITGYGPDLGSWGGWTWPIWHDQTTSVYATRQENNFCQHWTIPNPPYHY
jgi:hypothetical protein